MVFDVVDRDGSLFLLKSDKGYTVVRKVGHGLTAEARSVIPGDMPKGGGEWTARWSDRGIEYVASWYSYSWAREIFNRKTESEYKGASYLMP